jgi:hypothetical protein
LAEKVTLKGARPETCLKDFSASGKILAISGDAGVRLAGIGDEAPVGGGTTLGERVEARVGEMVDGDAEQAVNTSHRRKTEPNSLCINGHYKPLFGLTGAKIFETISLSHKILHDIEGNPQYFVKNTGVIAYLQSVKSD